VGDEQLGEMFSNLNIEIKSAKVITKPSSRRKGVASAARSKGFGFVETASHEQQTAALQKLQGHKIDHREIVVKVANERESAVENPESLDAPKDDAAQ
jgi:RNA recognition motif-containing protein